MEAREPMRWSWRDVVAVVSGLEALAVAVWLVPASIHIVQWPASTGPTRLALLPPLWQLVSLCAAAAVLAQLVLRMSGRLARRVRPFSLLWLWIVPYLPWLPDRLPLLLVLAGPLRWSLAATSLAMMLSESRWVCSGMTAILRLQRTTVFVMSLALYVGFGMYAVRTIGLSGDEPHYLIITESLLKDGDLKIENNHRQGDYRSFTGANLRPDFWERGKDGEIYSVHAPGLAVLVLPFYAVAGHWGAVALMCLLAALTALAVFDVADRLAGRSAAVLTWAAVCLTVPFVPQAWSLFPETPGALLVAWAVRWLVEPGERSVATSATSVTWAWRGAMLSTLPWLHTKFSVCLAIVGLALAWRLWPRVQAIVGFLMPIGLSAAAWFYSFFMIYGSFNPEAPYGNYANEYVLARNIPHGLLGLFLDQKFGLLVYSPIYLLAIVGAWPMLRRRDTRVASGVLLVLAGAFVASTARLYMFWGGMSAPARFLMPILPCLAPFVALGLASVRGPALRGLAGVWLSISLAIAALSMTWPDGRVLFSDPHGHARLLELIQASTPLSAVLPTFTEPDWASHVGTLAAWLSAGLAGLVAAVVSARTGRRGAWQVAFVASLTFFAAGTLVAAEPSADIRNEVVGQSAIDVIWRFDADRHRAIDYSGLGRVGPSRVQELSTITLMPNRSRVAGGGPVAGPLMLPAGAYEATLWFNDAGPRNGEVLVTANPPATYGRVAGVLENPTKVRFDLPVTVWRLAIVVSNRLVGGAVGRVEIVPRAVVPPSRRERAVVRGVEPLEGRERGYLAYTDGNAYPEGGVFWSRDTAATKLLVVPAGASRIVLTLFTGPRTGTVDVSVADIQRSIAMTADRPQDVVFDLPRGQRLVALSVRSRVMFHPADADPSSTDTRALGCQVRPRLE